MAALPQTQIGIIGGSGLYEMEGLTDPEEVTLQTPFGPPSDAFRVGTLAGRRVAFLARHGRGHRLLPSELNFRANIYGFKRLGVERLFSVSAVGSLREAIQPLDLVIVDQFVDRTRHRVDTFFGDGIVGHVAFGDPICPALRELAVAQSRTLDLNVHPTGTYVCMEGPQFSTRAESELYRAWGMDVIGMTNLQEAKLAREAEICYLSLAFVTDYDCWHASASDVDIQEVLANLGKNVARAQALLTRLVEAAPAARTCSCAAALATAIVTDRARIPEATRAALEPILGRYLS